MNEMIEVELTPEDLATAIKRGEELGELKNSITRGEGNVAGFLGEIAAQKVMGGELANTRDYDLVVDDGTKYDVKTKRCKNAPEAHYECSIANFNTTQKCQKYVFVRVQNDYKKAWICGELEKEEYFRRAVFIQQGQFDPRNRWRCSADCYNVRMDQLEPIQKPKPKEKTASD